METCAQLTPAPNVAEKNAIAPARRRTVAVPPATTRLAPRRSRPAFLENDFIKNPPVRCIPSDVFETGRSRSCPKSRHPGPKAGHLARKRNTRPGRTLEPTDKYSVPVESTRSIRSIGRIPAEAPSKNKHEMHLRLRRTPSSVGTARTHDSAQTQLGSRACVQVHRSCPQRTSIRGRRNVRR